MRTVEEATGNHESFPGCHTKLSALYVSLCWYTGPNDGRQKVADTLTEGKYHYMFEMISGCTDL